MVRAIADDDAPASVANIVQLEIEHLAWPKPALEHQQHYGDVAQLAKRSEQFRRLLCISAKPDACFG
jgi:hypothetical protein